MRVHPDSVVALKEAYFKNKPELSRFVAGRLKVNKQTVVGVHAKHFKEVCKVLKLPISKLKSSRTVYRGVYMATVDESFKSKLKDKRQEMRQKYIEIASGLRSKKAVEHLKHAIHDQEARIHAIQIDLVNNLRNLEGKNREYKVICEGDQGITENKGVEFDKLMANPDIVRIFIDDNYFTVWTRPIYIKYNNKIYDVGEFKIVLAINPTEFIVKMRNLTRKIKGYAHPHIRNNGRPCLGNIQECLPQMIAARQFAAAIFVCIQYLKSVNDSGYYVNIHNWPLKMAKRRGK